MATQVKKPGTPSAVRQAIGSATAATLEANPAIKRLATDAAQVYFHRDFLTNAECATLIAMIDEGRRPSTLLSRTEDRNFRTSDSCDMDRYSPIIQPIDERVAALLGIQPEHGETMQGQRYAPGQQFRAHHDYFHEGEHYWPKMQQAGGQRTWTAMCYLNEVEEGGATWFPQAGIRVPPRKRMLLIWNNMNPDGSPNEHTLHEGMAVVRGTKYIFTKWFREQPWLQG
ncbi:2OG-Fe(II) oxygenase [Sphingomonas sp. S1-29]|uniref:prolyl hydroxylase family protein n=1 Tax=Sphingomonas sp. S1-29 TaxID=2991074 RepID=UPI0022400BF5|nr:2OG-Fe(II) oxygenase [Sphingomonas sp. S1-29]UZK69688.1 2OG-Fe(II) oxygenase [Sphingomonas sp. S1-29]